MFKESTFFMSALFVILFSFAAQFGSVSYAQKPILTDEFDRFLVTKETDIGDVLGKIELVVPNEKKITWSLVPPVPGGDRRHYLKEGQLDATKIVEIDANTAEIRLKKRPAEYPAHYYAEVRATNEDGLPVDDYPDEYLAFGLDIYYGVRSHRSYNGMPLIPENLKIIDPELYDILSFLFPTREEFFKQMGWEEDLR